MKISGLIFSIIGVILLDLGKYLFGREQLFGQRVRTDYSFLNPDWFPHEYYGHPLVDPFALDD